MAEHNDLGDAGEEMAALHLLKTGYEILIRNYVFQKGEIDIIARKAKTIVVVEVKTRSTPDFGNPQDFLKTGQIQRLGRKGLNVVQLRTWYQRRGFHVNRHLGFIRKSREG